MKVERGQRRKKLGLERERNKNSVGGRRNKAMLISDIHSYTLPCKHLVIYFVKIYRLDQLASSITCKVTQCEPQIWLIYVFGVVCLFVYLFGFGLLGFFFGRT